MHLSLSPHTISSSSCLSLCVLPSTLPCPPHGLKTSGGQKNYVGSVAQPTQKFKTPLSSSEASWNDNPDDSGLWNRIIIKYKANKNKKHMAHLQNTYMIHKIFINVLAIPIPFHTFLRCQKGDLWPQPPCYSGGDDFHRCHWREMAWVGHHCICVDKVTQETISAHTEWTVLWCKKTASDF